MNKSIALMLVGTSVLTIVSTANAQTNADPSSVNARRETAELEEIIVTARRKEESLQDVPQAISAITGDALEKLQIVNFNDIQKLTSGLNLTSGVSDNSLTLRGVTFSLATASAPTVQFYLNDAATGNVFDATYDIGQIEILRGPQGTLRGKSAPSGAITVTTKRPDLEEVGGYVNVSGTNHHGANAQAAVGLPIIKDILAVRVAGVIDQTDSGGVKSVNNSSDPRSRIESIRSTLRFEPTGNISTTVMYQVSRTDTKSFDAVSGPGNGSNGPVIALGDRLSVTDGMRSVKPKSDLVTGQAEWAFAGQKLSYVGSYKETSSVGYVPQDLGNLIPSYDFYQRVFQNQKEQTQELRLASEERVAGFLDYTIGAFYDRANNRANVRTSQNLSGAFGRPGTTPVAGTPNERYVLGTSIDIANVDKEMSYFASLTTHIADRTEISVGGRYIVSKLNDNTNISGLGAFNAITNPLIPSPAFCAFLPGVPAGTAASPVYTGLPAVCDIPIAAGIIQSVENKPKDTPFIYNVSASHRFTDDFLVYTTYGTSFRPGPASVGLTSLLDCCVAPSTVALTSIRDLVYHKPEKSTSLELGLKSSFMANRLKTNLALYQQKFKNYFYLTQSTYYLSVNNPASPATGASVSQFSFTANAPATVKGVDADVSFQVTPRWNVGGSASWSKSKLDNAVVPCNDGNFDGTPDNIVPTTAGFFATNQFVARCKSDNSINRTPDWNVSAQSEFTVPITSIADGFVRGNLVYYPNNPYASEGVVIDKYYLLDVVLGVRAPKGDWEVSAFAKNVTNSSQTTGVGVGDAASGSLRGFFGASNYSTVNYTPRREFGLGVRYAFGSR